MKYLKIFTDFLEIAQGLSDSTLARLFRAMLAYALNDTEPAFKGNERALWLMVRQSIDREKEAYADMVEARREAGRRSGMVRREQNEQKRTKANKTNQDKDKDKEKEKDKDKDKDKDSLSFGGAAAPVEREKHPSLEEVMAFSQEAGLDTDVQYFYHYYEANGWHMGKQPIRDWRAALKAWALKTPTLRPAPARKPDFLDNFRGAMELLNMEEAKEV